MSGRYWCHTCEREIKEILENEDGELLCPECKNFFVEEMEDIDTASARTDEGVDRKGPNNTDSKHHGNQNIRSSNENRVSNTNGNSSSSSSSNSRVRYSATFGNNVHFEIVQGGMGAFPFPNMLNQIHGGARMSFLPLLNNLHRRGHNQRSIQEIIDNIMLNDSNRYGSPPASENAVKQLKELKIDQTLLEKISATQCSVCQDDFKEGETVKQLPCEHYYHSDCILPWLKLHNSCPTCRYQLPTDDEQYDARNRRRQTPLSQRSQFQTQEGEEGSSGTTNAPSSNSTLGNNDSL
mmetsp:Transcript_16481/g.23039  ORF Transcript_16481/g.23039 Transcript_16481/m.23039 type:complete len:294 (+) Transcript_16481:240-1121(+)|eukprot:CAMPEP_0184478514 /NCGR_PEP_ID=MMETSP0113_2-20130426/519_1 /TAXON_ID=91329 /ORGANISM="Norrisiella sphaerica, Strain BC52" /LENGTH=293 /DNA_ID=CAMNT_0026856333 /DNA_START=209 /DNA_END=1090 /DNA_ORIENTATION=-